MNIHFLQDKIFFTRRPSITNKCSVWACWIMTIQSKICIPAVIGVISQQSFFNILRFEGNLHKREFQCFEWMNVMNEWFESKKIGQKSIIRSLRANETKIWGFQSRIESGKLQEEKKIEEPIEFFIRNLKINRMAYFFDLMKVSFREKKNRIKNNWFNW